MRTSNAILLAGAGAALAAFLAMMAWTGNWPISLAGAIVAGAVVSVPALKYMALRNLADMDDRRRRR